ncbi:MAG: hypothetical protein JWO38_3879 [Gemmataceae bacterium]|nr:hypothetical protein [Gemmataceae bacterium]
MVPGPAPAAPLPVVPVPVPVEELSPAEELGPEPTTRPGRPVGRSHAPAASPGGPGTLIKVGFFVLLPYALLMTGLAVYGLFFKSGAPAGHPLSTIPDDFGEFKPAERKKVSKLTGPLDAPLPPELRVAVGSKLAIGQLEIEPTQVEERGLKIISEGKGGGGTAKYTVETPTALVLHLKVRNTSDDLLIHPLDPAFNRKALGNDRPGTGLVVGKQTFWGGAVDWPFGTRVERKYEAAQETDAVPLKPGETREYVVVSDSDRRVTKAVRDSKDPVLWRVQVRRGKIEYRGKDVPVTAIIGVEFKPADVKGLD